MRATAPALICCAAFTFAATVHNPRDYASVKQKFASIESRKLPKGSQVKLTPSELNAYVATELPKAVPEGITNTRVELGQDRGTGRAVIDFMKLRQAKGLKTNWLMMKLLEGQHDVTVTARIQSGGGRATVFVERVEIAGVPIHGGAVDYLIRRFVLPNYPNAKIGEPFELGHNMERIDVRPSEARVVIGGQR